MQRDTMIKLNAPPIAAKMSNNDNNNNYYKKHKHKHHHKRRNNCYYYKYNIIAIIAIIVVLLLILLAFIVKSKSYEECHVTNVDKYPPSLDGSINYDRNYYKKISDDHDKHDYRDNSFHFNHFDDDAHDDDNDELGHSKYKDPLRVHNEYGKLGKPFGRYIELSYSGNRSPYSCSDDNDMMMMDNSTEQYHDWINLNPRRISNIVHHQGPGEILNKHGLNSLWIFFGQFLDHMLVLTHKIEGEDLCVKIEDFYDQIMRIKRSEYVLNEYGIREQINSLGSFVHADAVYGSNKYRNGVLRTGLHGGLQYSSPNNGREYEIKNQLPPLNDFGLENEPSSESKDHFICGDVRCNENIALASIHTLFLREHNYWANYFKTQHSSWSDEQIFHKARGRVIAEIQYIVYEEFLPALLGKDVWGKYENKEENKCFDPYIDPRIYNEFSTVAYRFGHTCISDTIEYRDEYSGEYEGYLGLFDTFFNPELLRDGTLSPGNILLGTYYQPCQEIDIYISDIMRNFSSNGHQLDFDIATFNILRARADHSTPNYITLRWKTGGSPVTDWYDISSDHNVVQRLKEAYGDKGWDKLDAWVGILAEDHKQGAAIGRTGWKIIKDQFERLKFGDYNFYLWDKLNENYISEIHGSGSLRDIILRNTHIKEQYIHKDIFHVPKYDDNHNHKSSSSSSPSSNDDDDHHHH